MGVASAVIWYALRQNLPLIDIYSGSTSAWCWSLTCLSSASLRLHFIVHRGHSYSSFLCAVFLCRRTSLLRLNERWHSSHEPLSSFFLGFLCSIRCDPELPPPPPLLLLLLLLGDAVLKNCTSNGSGDKSIAASSPPQVAWNSASPTIPPNPSPNPNDKSS